MASEVLCRAATHTQAGSLEEYRSELGEVSAKVLDAQPAMAPLVTLVRGVLASVEAAASTLMDECDTVLLGADSIGDLGVVNKIGSAGLVDAAMRHEVPVMVVSDETKILPTGFPQHIADDRAPEEVWRAPAGVRVWNRYFELFELERVTVVVTESAALTPLEVEELRKGIVLPPGLLMWADARVGRTPDV